MCNHVVVETANVERQHAVARREDIHMRPLADGRSLLDRVTDSVRTAILDGEFPPGSRISVPEIARQLGVSRTPAREALMRLAHEGLVEVLPRRGAVVLNNTFADVRSLFQYREAIEGMAARLAAETMSESAKRSLRKAYERHAEAVAATDLDGHVRFDAVFHSEFAEGSGNRYIIAELNRVRSMLKLLTYEMTEQPGALQEPLVRVHERILLAIEEGDGDAAESAARRHVRAILEFYVSHPNADVRLLPPSEA